MLVNIKALCMPIDEWAETQLMQCKKKEWPQLRLCEMREQSLVFHPYIECTRQCKTCVAFYLLFATPDSGFLKLQFPETNTESSHTVLCHMTS